MTEKNFVSLQDADGTIALVAPELGGWLLRYARPMPNHGLVDALHFSQAVVDRYPREMYAGNPILFPLVSNNHVGDKEHHYLWNDHFYEMPQHGFADVPPGETRTFSFVARRPGVFLYHCGTSPVLQHIGMGMYGAILVDPAGGRAPAREKVLVQSEFYGPVEHGLIHPTYRAMQTRDPTFAAFNGRAFHYRDNPIDVPVGEPVRLYVVAAGPTLGSDFHVVGEIFDAVQPDGNPLDVLSGVSTYGVPAGGGAVFELSFDEAGRYPFVTHSFRWADAGALGFFEAS